MMCEKLIGELFKSMAKKYIDNRERSREESYTPRYALGRLIEESVKARLGDREEHLSAKNS